MQNMTFLKFILILGIRGACHEDELLSLFYEKKAQ